jgi:hypothetical protein
MKTSIHPAVKFLLIAALVLILHASHLRAQATAPFTVTGTNAEFEFLGDGTLISTGTFDASNLPWWSSSAPSAISWWPSQAAFRVGVAPNPASPNTVIGQGSTAFGLISSASGYCATASGWYSIAAGTGTVAMGWETTAGSFCDTAFGNMAYAVGSDSFAVNQGTDALNWASSASGCYTEALGVFSSSSGYGTHADAYGSFVVGLMNAGGGNPNAWVSTDPLFEVGNGTYTWNTGTGTNSDAFVVYKNGNAVVSGTLTVAPGGDIPMFSGD